MGQASDLADAIESKFAAYERGEGALLEAAAELDELHGAGEAHSEQAQSIARKVHDHIARGVVLDISSELATLRQLDGTPAPAPVENPPTAAPVENPPTAAPAANDPFAAPDPFATKQQ